MVSLINGIAVWARFKLKGRVKFDLRASKIMLSIVTAAP